MFLPETLKEYYFYIAVPESHYFVCITKYVWERQYEKLIRNGAFVWCLTVVENVPGAISSPKLEKTNKQTKLPWKNYIFFQKITP